MTARISPEDQELINDGVMTAEEILATDEFLEGPDFSPHLKAVIAVLGCTFAALLVVAAVNVAHSFTHSPEDHSSDHDHNNSTSFLRGANATDDNLTISGDISEANITADLA
ncbi:MAG: hypothetical protein RLN62_04185 [Rickettsiales bacterium]